MTYQPLIALIFTIINWQASGKIGPTGAILVGLLGAWLGAEFLNVEISKHKFFNLFRWFVFAVILYTTVLEPVAFAIAARKLSGDITQIHDGLLQLEIASDGWAQGNNPYTINYFQTRLRDWPYRGATQINPALYHFAYLPGLVIFHRLLTQLTQPLLGTNDPRILLTLAYLGTLLAGAVALTNKDGRLSFPILFGLNPLTIFFLIEGRNDIFPFFWILLGVILAMKERRLLSALAFGLAVGSKQSSWLAVPFLLIYWLVGKQKRSSWSRWQPVFVLGGVFLVLSWRFMLADPGAFFRSTVAYPLGIGETSYPILQWSFGLSRLISAEGGNLQRIGPVFSFLRPVLIVGLLVYLLGRQMAANTITNVLIHYGVFLFFFWYLATYFNDNHVLFIIWILTAVYVISKPGRGLDQESTPASSCSS